MNCLRIMEVPVYLINIRAYLKYKIPTHYDVLEVLPNATSHEIKTAYYKLSMQYHPDRNKSEAAKVKFQNISDAYEILNNYEARKKYDRLIAVKEIKVVSTSEKIHKVKKKEYQVYPASKIYNFDEWSRMHYQFSLQRAQRVRYQAAIDESERKKLNKKKEDNIFLVIMYSVLSVFLITGIYISSSDPENKTTSSKVIK